MPFTLPPDANGILPDRMIAAMTDAGLILPEYPFVFSNSHRCPLVEQQWLW